MGRQPWRTLACLATATVGVLGTAALVGANARPSVQPAPGHSVAHEADPGKAMDESLNDTKGILGPHGFLKVKGLQSPEIGELRPNVIDVGNLTEPEFPKMQELPETPELPEMPELPELPEFPKMEVLPKMPELPQMPVDVDTMVKQHHAHDFPELPEIPQLPEPSENLDLPHMHGSGSLPLPIDASNETQSLVDKVKTDALEMMTSIGWNMDLAPFKALTYCEQAAGGLVSTVKIQVRGGQVVQLTVTSHDGTNSAPVLLGVVAVQAGDRSCMGKPFVSRATKEIQKFANNAKVEVPALLSSKGWPGVDIEPYRAISYCSQGTHLIVRLHVRGAESLRGADLQLWIHRHLSSPGDGMETLVSSAAMIKSSDKRCVAAWVNPTGEPKELN